MLTHSFPSKAMEAIHLPAFGSERCTAPNRSVAFSHSWKERKQCRMVCECKCGNLHVKITYLWREVDCAKGVMEGELDAREDPEGVRKRMLRKRWNGTMCNWAVMWPPNWRVEANWKRWKDLWWREGWQLRVWKAMSKGGTGLAFEKRICVKIRNCSQEGGEKKMMRNKRNLGGDGN